MKIISFGRFYLGYESDNFYDFSVHFGNFLLEYQCPNVKGNGTIQKDDGSGHGKTSEGNGAV